MPAYVLFGGVRELIAFLCCASHASSGDCAPSFVRAVVESTLSSSLLQRGLREGVSLVESWRNGDLAVAQGRTTIEESALKYCLASADIDVDRVTGASPFSHRHNSSVAVDHHEPRCIIGGIRGAEAEIMRSNLNIQSQVPVFRSWSPSTQRNSQVCAHPDLFQ